VRLPAAKKTSGKLSAQRGLFLALVTWLLLLGRLTARPEFFLFLPAIMTLAAAASLASILGFISVVVSVVSLRRTPRGI
jgi:hypothetical protein